MFSRVRLIVALVVGSAFAVACSSGGMKMDKKGMMMKKNAMMMEMQKMAPAKGYIEAHKNAAPNDLFGGAIHTKINQKKGSVFVVLLMVIVVSAP